MNKFKALLFATALLSTCFLHAHEPAGTEQLRFIKNLNQFHPNVLYLAELRGGAIYLEQSTLTYVFYNADDLQKLDEFFHHPKPPEKGKWEEPPLRGHAYKVHLKGAKLDAVISSNGKFTDYRNYFFGQDMSKWASHVPLFHEVIYNGIYPGVDLKFYSEGNNPKYDFIVHAGADAKTVALNFEGADGLTVKEGELKIKTSVATIIEQKPHAYQIIDGKKFTVACGYKLQGQTVSFDFPEGYSSKHALIIDPVIIASTFSGETYRAYGHTAAYDEAGNIYSGGKAFSTNVNGSGSGYPATPGAFQTFHAGGYQDMAISKYNPDGSQLLWATYLGGGGQDSPHSFYVNANQELYIYGSSNSPDFPVSANAYDPVNQTDNFGNQLFDIVVTKLTADGSALTGSTYVGGRTENDGYNSTNVIRYYGDYYKGEIVVDDTGNAFVASYAHSTDFPTTANVIQPAYGGGSLDGVIFKLNSDLSQLEWSTFLGGPLDDACYGLKLDANGDLFVTGTVSSNILSNTAGTVNPNYIGGDFDVFVAHVSANGQQMVRSTYFGSLGEEQAYLLDLDGEGNVYIFGSSPDNFIQPTPGAYRGVLGGAFIAKFNPALDSIGFITTFNEIAPTALMIDECDRIYAAGHGGLNVSAGTASGFETTSDAFQTGSGGFYLMTLEKNATALVFGSYYGPPLSHVDGGTSRFDKRGVMYHALCTDEPTFYTTPWAYQPTKLATDFDNCVFKIDFQAGVLVAEAEATVGTGTDTLTLVEGCPPLTVHFVNNSTNATFYLWNFGNGDTSSAEEPVYTYTDTGLFHVMLIALNPASCNERDTSYVTVDVRGPVAAFTYAPPFATPGGDIAYTNQSINANSYLWDFGDGDTSAAINPVHAFADYGEYLVCLTATSEFGCADSVCELFNLNNYAVDVPNAFSPNGDAQNNILYVKGQGVETVDFRVYNRWGEKVFETDNMNVGWDGTYKDEPQPVEAYGYYLKAVFFNGEIVEKKGNVTLLR